MELLQYKAIFFDRDDTLTFNDPGWETLRDDKLSEWSGVPFLFSHELFMEIFREVFDDGHDYAPYKNVEQELKFFAEWYRVLFKRLGITEQVSERVDYLMQHLWYLKKELFEETIEVLEYFKSRGYKMGVISDCPPSLEMTLRSANIHHYFSSFTASSLVGVGKPHPRIFNAALDSLGVTAGESIYVDDYEVEAVGAREQGFTSFLIDRSGKSSGQWTIQNLSELVEYVERLD